MTVFEEDYDGKKCVKCFVFFAFACDSQYFLRTVIEVDKDDPYNNREVVITYVPAEKVGGRLRTIYRVDIDNQDLRDVLADMFVLRLVEDHPNWAELTMPTCCYTRRVAEEALKMRAVEHEEEHFIPHVQHAMDAARNAIGDKTKKLLLKFEDNVILSNDSFLPDSINGKVDYTMLPVESSFQFGANKAYGITTTCVSWRLTTVEGTKRVLEVPRVVTAADKLAARLARMSTS